MRRAACLVLATLVAFGLVGATASAAKKCTMAGSQPDAGSIALEFLRNSSKNKNRNDYRLSGTLRWDSAEAIACFKAGHVDWAFEYDIFYQQHFDRKIWNVKVDQFPDRAHPYIDTTASDEDDVTSFSLGIFRPDELTAGVTYWFSYEIFLPREPKSGKHSFYVRGEVLERDCPKAGPWCVGLRRSRRHTRPLVGIGRTFSVNGRSCWSWRKGVETPAACPSRTPSSPPAGAGSPGSQPAPANPGPVGSPTVSLRQGPVAPAGFRYAVTLGGFAPNSSIGVSCHDSVDPGGFFSFALATDGAGNAFTESQCYSGDGPDHWVIAGGVESNHVRWGGGGLTPTPPAPPPVRTWPEQQGSLGANTFTNPYNASGMGLKIAPYQWVEVACKVHAPQIASANPDGYWYRIASPPWSNAFYAVANTFWNGDIPGQRPYTHNTDWAVPNC